MTHNGKTYELVEQTPEEAEMVGCHGCAFDVLPDDCDAVRGECSKHVGMVYRYVGKAKEPEELFVYGDSGVACRRCRYNESGECDKHPCRRSDGLKGAGYYPKPELMDSLHEAAEPIRKFASGCLNDRLTEQLLLIADLIEAK